MNAPVQQVAGAEPWSAARWTDPHVARAAEIFKREAVDRYRFGDGGRLPMGERERIIRLIASDLGRPFSSVANRLNNYGQTFAAAPTKHRAVRGDRVASSSVAGRGAAWSLNDVATAAGLFQSDVTDAYDGKPPHGALGAAFVKIAAAVGREAQAVASRYGNYGPSFSADHGASSGGAAKASAFQLAERDKRAAARRAQDVTGSLFGDPPPGYSALDRRRQQ